MGQLNHPYSKEVKASMARRLKSVGGQAGKAWGNSATLMRNDSYPSTHAGTDRPLTIAGKSSPKRADRYAKGGRVKKKGNVTNVVVAMPSKEPAAVPVPVPAGGPPGAPPMPPMGGPPMGGAPMRPPMAGVRPPGMASGGVVADAAPKKTYRGFPHSPTTEVDEAVSAQKKGGVVKKKAYARGGKVKKRPFGGPVGGMPPQAMAGLANGPAMPTLPPQAMASLPPQAMGGARPFKKGGGTKAGSGTGLSRMQRNKSAGKIPAKTEV